GLRCTSGERLLKSVGRAGQKTELGVEGSGWNGCVEAARGVVGNVIPPEIHSEFHVVSAVLPGVIVRDLVLGDVSSLGPSAVENASRDVELATGKIDFVRH